MNELAVRIAESAQVESAVVMALGMFLLIAIMYQIKHFICDYPLQTPYMLGKFKPGWEFLGPLAAHCGVHALFTFTLSSYLLWDRESTFFFAGWLASVDFVIHFIMDRIKAGPKYLGRFKDMYHKYFWWSLGFDQMVHHLTHYFIIIMTFIIGIAFP